VYSRKAGLSPHQIELDNMQWTKLQKYYKFIYSRISHFSQDGFFNKFHQDLNDLNAWTYDIFLFVSKKHFHPFPTVFTPSGHGLHFPELKMEIDFSKKPGIMEILWKTSTMVHHTTKPPPEIINHDELTHFGFSFQMNHKLFNVGEKFLKMTPTTINSRVNGYCERNMQDQKRTKKY
ncbi:hypothetical protein O181_037001, partial [Austropuccinia psidii MF-1]|nr:hypothetical protein [Austropuccinia psidii MF-1]